MIQLSQATQDFQDVQGGASPVDLATFTESPGAGVDLSAFDDDFEQTEVDQDQIGDVPDGRYQVEITKADLRYTKTNHDPMLVMELTILGPKYNNRKIWHNRVFLNSESMRWLKNDLTICGLKLARLTDLNHRLNELVGVRLEIVKRTNGEYTNIYFQKRLVAPPKPTGDIPY